MMQSPENLTRNERKKVSDMLRLLIDSEFNLKIAKEENDKLRKLVVQTFIALDITDYELSDESNTDLNTKDIATFKLVQSSKIIYDLEKIKDKLDKAVVKQITNTKYLLDNVEGFKLMLKEYEVPNKEVKKYIKKEQSVSESKLKHLYEAGELQVADLKDCYTVKDSEPYIRVNFKKSKE